MEKIRHYPLYVLFKGSMYDIGLKLLDKRKAKTRRPFITAASKSHVFRALHTASMMGLVHYHGKANLYSVPVVIPGEGASNACAYLTFKSFETPNLDLRPMTWFAANQPIVRLDVASAMATFVQSMVQDVGEEAWDSFSLEERLGYQSSVVSEAGISGYVDRLRDVLVPSSDDKRPAVRGEIELVCHDGSAFRLGADGARLSHQVTFYQKHTDSEGETTMVPCTTVEGLFGYA